MEKKQSESVSEQTKLDLLNVTNDLIIQVTKNAYDDEGYFVPVVREVRELDTKDAEVEVTSVEDLDTFFRLKRTKGLGVRIERLSLDGVDGKLERAIYELRQGKEELEVVRVYEGLQRKAETAAVSDEEIQERILSQLTSCLEDGLYKPGVVSEGSIEDQITDDEEEDDNQADIPAMADRVDGVHEYTPLQGAVYYLGRPTIEQLLALEINRDKDN